VIIPVAVEKLPHFDIEESASHQEALLTIFPSLLDIMYHPNFGILQKMRVFQRPPLFSPVIRGPANASSLRQVPFDSTINKVAGNGLKLKATLGIGSERGCGTRACNRLDGRQAEQSHRSAFAGSDDLAFSLFTTRAGSRSGPATSELDSRFFGANRGTEPSQLSAPRSDAGI
jgi:hypothetical protein